MSDNESIQSNSGDATTLLTTTPTATEINTKSTKKKNEYGKNEIDIFPALKKIAWNSIQDATKEDQKKFIEDLIECCQFRQDFDVYQVLAFESTDPDRDIVDLWNYRFKCLKGFLCSLTQIFAMGVVLYQLARDGMAEKELCWNDSPLYMRILSFFLSTYLSYTTIRELSDTKGFYAYILLKGFNAPWIDHGWLYFGFVVNTVAAVTAVWGSFFIIFWSDHAVEMVLNSVALFFLVDLDDLLVDDRDYAKIKEQLGLEEEEFDKRQKPTGRIKAGVCGTVGDWIVNAIVLMVGGPFQILRLITIVLCVFIPFYIAICF